MATYTLTADADVFPGAGVNTGAADTIHGLEGNDVIGSGNGDDWVYGDDGADLLKGGHGADTLNGDAGADRLYGGIGDDVLNGGSEADTLWGQDGDDTLNGGDGNDVMYGGLGADAFDGGDGNDVVSYRYATAGVTLAFGQPPVGTDEGRGDIAVSVERFILSGFNDAFSGYTAAVTVLAAAGNDSVRGSDLNDTLFGGAGNDTLMGQDGADRIYGEDGVNDIYGGAGDDILDGGSDLSEDYISGDAGNDRIYGVGQIDGGADNDVITVRSNGSVYANAHGGDGDDRIYGGVGTDYLYGDAGNDTIYAGNLNNRLDGGEGNDRLFAEFGGCNLYGGGGDDFMQAKADSSAWTYFYGGAGFDTVSYRNAVGDSWDRGVEINGTSGVNGAATNDQYSAVERFVLSDFDDILVAGSLSVAGFAFEARGYDGNDSLEGGAGLDSLFGGAGNDTLAGGLSDDNLYGGAGDDQLLGGDGDDLLNMGPGGDSATGGTGADTFLIGNWSGSGTIEDFEMGTDVLDVQGLVDAGVQYYVNDNPGGAYVAFDNGYTLWFSNLYESDVQNIVDNAYAAAQPPLMAPASEAPPQDSNARVFAFDGSEWLLAG